MNRREGGPRPRLLPSIPGAGWILRRLRSQTTFVAFILPATIFLIVLVIYPVVATLTLGFVGADGQFTGLDNFATVIGSKQTVNADCLQTGPPCGTLINNLIWIGLHLPLTMFMGLFLAMLLQRVRGAAIVKSMIFLGMVTPLIVIGTVLKFILEAPIGLVPAFFGSIGIKGLAVNWLTSNPSTLLFGLIMGTVWSWTGFSMIVYSAGLTTIPKDYFEAARVDGASEWQVFRKITWPLLKPVTLVIVTMTVLWELKLFDIVIGATNQQGGLGGAADVLALQMYRFFYVQDYNHAAVVATLLTIFTFVVSISLFRELLNLPRHKRRLLRARAKPAEVGTDSPQATIAPTGDSP